MISSMTVSPKTSLPRSAIFSNLLVISKSSSFPFKGSNLAPAEIGRLLNARYLLDGSVRRAANRVRVGVQLTEATTGRLVPSTPTMPRLTIFSRSKTPIAKKVVSAAAVELTRFEMEHVVG